METYTYAHYKEFISCETKYMSLLQTDDLYGSFYKCSSFYHCRNHKRNFKEGSKDWLDMQAVLDLVVIYQVLF